MVVIMDYSFLCIGLRDAWFGKNDMLLCNRPVER